MKILSITAQKPHSTGSGFYLTELVNNWYLDGHEQAVVAGVCHEDRVNFAKEIPTYLVYYETDKLPFPIAGMSDEMPYISTRYQDMTEEMVQQYADAFSVVVAQAVEELNPDVIVCHHLYLLTALVRSWYPDRNVVGVCHGSDLRQIQKNPLERTFIQEQIRKLDKIIALQHEQCTEIERIFCCDPERIYAVGAGFNANIFYQDDLQLQKNASGKKQIVFAGKVSEKKGVRSLIRAMDRLPYPEDSICLKIAGGHGEEEEFAAICALAKQCKYEVEFTGPLSQIELAELFRASDLFVLPSFYEGLGLVTMEAMACGCKVVCSDNPGVKEWYDEQVPEHRVRFVQLPRMVNTDEPIAEELPEFEKRLADAMIEKLEQEEVEKPNLDRISWKGISRKILKIALEEG